MLLAFPFLLLVGVLVYFDVGFPVLFRQYRPGLHGKAFMLLKFRTMNSNCDINGVLLPDADR